MAKKATLLKRALKLKLDVTEKSTVPEITAALEAHEKKTAKTPTQVKSERPQEQNTPTEPVQPETPVESASEPQINLKDILMMYNSVTPSRRRWIMNRNELRNRWKEFFQLLEIASGRTGQKAEILDYNWHKVVDKGGEPGLGNLERDEVKVVIDDGAAVADTTAKDQKILELEAEVTRLTEELSRAKATPIVDADNTAGEVPSNPNVLGEDGRLPGETSTLNENANESSIAKEKGETVESETPADLTA